MAESPHFAEIDAGHELEPLVLTLTPDQVRRYALAAHMPGPRFMSDEGAREEGLPGQIVPGNMSLALFSRLISGALPGAIIQRLSATFRGLVRPGRPLSLRGVVTEKHVRSDGQFVECDLVLESDEGDRWVTGTATVKLPS